MENVETLELSKSDYAQHAANQAQKILRAQIETLKNERNFLRLLLQDLSANTSAPASLSARLRSYEEYRNLEMHNPVYEQVDINLALIEMCNKFRAQLLATEIEVYFDKIPKFLSDANRVSALFANLCHLTIFDVKGANSIHIDFETSKSGNRLLWEIGKPNSYLTSSDKMLISQSSFLSIAQRLAPTLGTTLSLHFLTNHVLVELHFDNH